MILLLVLGCSGPDGVGRNDSVADSAPDTAPGDTADSTDTAETTDTDTADTVPPPDADGDGSPDAEDCAPADPYTFPGAEEWCDLVDHDCDGEPLPPGVCGKAQLVEALDGASRITAPDHLDYAPLVHFLDDMDGEPGQELGIETATPTSWDPTAGHYTLAVVSAPLPSRDTTLTEAATTFLVSYGEDVRHWLPAGDFDGDGHNDLVMVSYGYFYPGWAYLVRGPISRYSGTVAIHEVAAASWEQVTPGDAFGMKADAGGDANGDGLTDIVVSTELNEHAMTLLFYGRIDGLSPDMDTNLETANVGEGRRGVQFSGDQDGDGIDDVRLMSGHLDWVSGAQITPYAHEDWMSFGRRFVVQDDFSCSRLSATDDVPRLGDWDGDGLDDLLVDCNEDAWSPDGEGDSYLFVSGGDVPDAPTDATIHDLATGSWNIQPSWGGSASEDAGDLDGDGSNDLLILAREYDGDDVPPDTSNASTWVILSSDGPPDPWTNPTARGYAMYSDRFAPNGTNLIGAIGDFDGDGLADLAAGASEAGASDLSEAWLLPNWDIPWHDASLF